MLLQWEDFGNENAFREWKPSIAPSCYCLLRSVSMYGMPQACWTATRTRAPHSTMTSRHVTRWPLHRQSKAAAELTACALLSWQGTAGVVVAGLMSSSRLTGKALAEYTYLFYGAGMAGTGIADLIADRCFRLPS